MDTFELNSERIFHHLWCNLYSGPREGCPMCDRFYKLYPLTDDSGDLYKKYFPNVEVLRG